MTKRTTPVSFTPGTTPRPPCSPSTLHSQPHLETHSSQPRHWRYLKVMTGFHTSRFLCLLCYQNHPSCYHPILTVIRKKWPPSFLKHHVVLAPASPLVKKESAIMVPSWPARPALHRAPSGGPSTVSKAPHLTPQGRVYTSDRRVCVLSPNTLS